MAFLKVKVRGQDGVINSPGVLEGPREPGAQTFGGDHVSIAVKGDNEPPTGLLDLKHNTSVGQDDKLVDIREERKKEDVENDDPCIN